MATCGKPIPASLIRKIQLVRATTSLRKTARECGVSVPTVRKYTKST